MPKATDTILGHCVLRALIQDHGGPEAAKATLGPESGLTKWGALRATTKVTPKAMRVATFIVLWAIAMHDEKANEYSITEYQRYWRENERQAYRVQKEFRELWPEFETPNELARQIVGYIDRRMAKREAAKLPMTLRVEAQAL